MAAHHGRARDGHLQHQGRPLTDLLAADCSRCAGLCCVALPYARGREFPEDKRAGVACRHLGDDFGCRIHEALLPGGWAGCVTFDCFGAGQQVVQVTYGGRTWRERPDLAAEMFAVFDVVKALHEVRFLLADPACLASSYAAAAAAYDAELALLTKAGAEELLAVDLAPLRGRAGDLFARVAGERGGPSHRGALLMAADLRDRDLTDVDLLGADLRDADVRGADLRRSLFLTQPQVNAARGDDATRLPARVTRPAHWSPPRRG